VLPAHEALDRKHGAVGLVTLCRLAT
jgi:hypothetical protein